MSETFNVSTIALGLNVSHANRGDLRVRLVAPGGSGFNLIVQNTGNTDANYDIQVSTNSDGAGVPALDDNSTDNVGEPYYARLVNNAGMNFYTGAANGTWTLHVCDRVNNGVNGTFNRAKLILEDGQTIPQLCTSTISYEWGDNGNNNAFTSTVIDGVTMTLVSTRDLTNDGADTAGRDNFTTQTGTFGAEAGYYIMQFDDGASGPQSPEAVLLETTWSFDPPVRYQSWRHLDVDNGSWEDYIRVLATDSNGNAVPYELMTNATIHGLAGDIIETDGVNVDDTDPSGNVVYNFTSPVAQIVVQYMRGDDDADPASQRIGIGNPTFCAFDYGDAPDTYGTLLAGGARHVLGLRSVYLGSLPPDGEDDGQTAGGAATADDINAISGVDDEDGTESGLFPTCPNNGSYTMSVSASNLSTSSGGAFLVGYMDWNRDGDFGDAGEQSATTTVPQGNADPSSYVVTWSNVPANCGGTATTFARFRISTDQAAVESPAGQAPDGEVEDYQIGSGTLPVTLAWLASARTGGDLVVRWATVSESNNAGFRVWGLDARGNRTLLGRVGSKAPDGFAPQRYEARFPAAQGIVDVELEDVALAGGNRLHGPFAVGGEVGAAPDESARIDWAAIKAESGIVGPLDSFRSGDAGSRSALATERKKKLPSPSVGSGLGLLLVREKGIHRVTYEQLLAAGVDLSGVADSQIALIDNGVGVTRHVEMPAAVFGPGAFIEFVATPHLTLASPVDALVLDLDPSRAVAAGTTAGRPGGLGVTAAEAVRYSDHVYSYASSSGDPWFDARLLAWGGPASLTRDFDLPNLVDGAVEMDFKAWGYSEWPDNAGPDHHVVVKVNGAEVANQQFDGYHPLELTLDLTGLVYESGNTLEVRLPGDTGYSFDNMAFEGFAVRYPRETVAIDGRFEGSVALPFQIGGFTDGEPVSVWQLGGGAALRSQPTAFGGMAVAPGGGGTIFAAQGNAIRTPGIVAGVPSAKLSSNAEYLVVTHPAFVAGLGDLVALRQSQGLATEVVTTEEIYAAYSDHVAAPEAIRAFLQASWNQGQLRYVLLVGSDSTDPYDHLGLGSISYLPSFYLPYAVYPIFFSATDEQMVDFDADAVGEVPIGRLPVRSPAELDAVVTKILQWELNVSTNGASALMASGASDASREVADLNEAYAQSLVAWSPAVAQVDDLGTDAVRSAVLSALNSGVSLVSYVGHSSSYRWDFTPILQWQDAATLTNAGIPNLVTQWGCWNSYYMDPGYESLSAHLLRKPNAGVAAAIGAMTLTTDSAHRALGNLFFARIGAGAATVGDAFRGAKLDLAAQGWGEDALLGMALLGDPAMSLPVPAANIQRP